MDVINFGLIPSGLIVGAATVTTQTVAREDQVIKTAKTTEITDYILGSSALGIVALVSYVSYALKIYFDKRLEMSIKRQELDIKNQQEMIDRANKQFDILLTNILGSINEEKDKNLEVLERISVNEKEVAHTLHAIVVENHTIAMSQAVINRKLDDIMIQIKSTVDPTKKYAV